MRVRKEVTYSIPSSFSARGIFESPAFSSLLQERDADTSTSSTGNRYKTTTGSRDYLPEEPSLTQPNHSFQCYIEESSSRCSLNRIDAPDKQEHSQIHWIFSADC